MAYISSFICLLLGLISYHKYRRIYSPNVMFCLFWSFLLFLAGLKLYNIYEATDLSIAIIVIGVFSFTIGSLISSPSKHIRTYNYVLNNHFYKIAVFICVVSLYLNISFIIAFIKSGFDVQYIYSLMARMVGGEDDSDLSNLYNPKLVILQQFIGYPLLYTLVPISIVEYITSRKKQYLIVAVLLSIIRFLFDFRRTYIVIIVVFIIFVFIVKTHEILKERIKKIKKISLKKKITIACALSLTAIGFAMLSSARRGDNDDSYTLVSNFYYYYVGSVPYLSARLESIQNIYYTFGFTSFRGLISPIFAILNILGIDKPELLDIANENVNSLHNFVLNISPDHPFNSYATCFFEFYLDGGIIGVFILSSLFGFYSQKLFLDIRENKSNRYLVKYSFFMSLFLYLSVLHFNGVVVCYIWPFLIERFFYKRYSIQK